MSFSVRLYQGFKKKKNSTKLPTGKFDDIPCVLKAPTDIFNPTIEISYGEPFDAQDNTRLADYSYCHIPMFDRYYFVEAIRYVGRVWEVDLKCDVLASSRDDILASTKYVLRSASASDGRVVDDMYPMVADVDNRFNSYDCPYVKATDINQGVFVLGIMSKGTGNSVGVNTYYVLTYGQISAVLNVLFDQAPINSIADIVGGEWLARALMNPTQYLTSLMWLPYAPSNSNVPFTVGYVASQTTVPAVNTAHQNFSGTVSFHSHPQGTQYLQKQPFTEYNIYFPCFGLIPVDASRVGSKSVTYQIACDNFTGMAKMVLYGNDGTPEHLSPVLGTYNAQIGVPLPTAQMIQNGGGMLSGLINSFSYSANTVIGGAAKMGMGNVQGAGVSAVGGLLSVASGIGNCIAGSFPQAYQQGTMGSFSECNFAFNKIHTLSKFVKVTNKGNPQNGTPLMAQRELSALTGFTVCSEGAVDTKLSGTEKTEIEAFLTSGFYIE